MSLPSSSPRKKNLCAFLRSAAYAFIGQTENSPRASAKESVQFRNEVDSLFHLYENGDIDPVALLQQSPLDAADQHDPATAPLHGSTAAG